VGIFLLVLLALFAGPDTMPRLISAFVPNADEGIPCDWLRTAQDTANHQSLLGRAAENALALRIQASPVRQDAPLVINIIVQNTSIGTIPIVYSPQQVIVGDNGTSGLGIVFNPPNGLTNGNTRQDYSVFPEGNIRLLGPRQRCVHRMEFPASQVLSIPTLAGGGAQVLAYYRITSAGQVVIPAGAVATPIFPDQGLLTVRSGFVQSEPIRIELQAVAQ
jgi:hypothetical protein